MKRYSLHDPYFESELRECADGYLVDYEDVEKLQQQNAELLAVLKLLLSDARHIARNADMDPDRNAFAVAVATIAEVEGNNT